MKHLMYTYIILLGTLAGCVHQENDTAAPQLIDSTPSSISSGTHESFPTTGQGWADVFNRNYNETQTLCKDPDGRERGLYWCSGVMVRTVNNDGYVPWAISPNAARVGATSFSWIRHDEGTRMLYHPAGYIWMSPADYIGMKGNSSPPPGMIAWADHYACIYPFDAGTLSGNRAPYGCGLLSTKGSGSQPPDLPTRIPNPSAWGSCNQPPLSFTTAAQWNNHFQQQAGGVYSRSCSWYSDSSQYWLNMISSRQSFPRPLVWNEFMIDNDFGNNPQYFQNPITAFFYDVHRTGGLAAARKFQTDLATANERPRRAPILRLDFDAPNASRFSYNAGDQVAYP